jgi:hypothetical protein
MKILPVGAELFHEERKTDGQADWREDKQTNMTKLIALFAILRTGTKCPFCLFSVLTLQRMKLI